jgi:16S rRNA (uracil1498-N3)-methyltransferase
MDIFYKADIEGDKIILDQKESMHCIKVMRYRIGDHIRIIDGVGGYYEAEIIDENPKACRVLVVSKQENFEALPYELHIGIAPTKNMDRFEWFVEKATEIGITSITPLLCQRSERKNLRIDRLEKVMIAAAKQSVKASFPKIHELIRFEDWIKERDINSGLIAHCMEGEKEEIWNAKLSSNTCIIIGPEGDFTTEELNIALSNGFQAVSLGNYRLRTETAGVVACTAVYFNMQS